MVATPAPASFSASALAKASTHLLKLCTSLNPKSFASIRLYSSIE